MPETLASIGYPLFLVSGLELLLGFILLSQNHRNSPLNKAAAAIAFFSAVFALSTAIMYVRASVGLGYNHFARANWIGWFTIPAALQYLYYLKDERSAVARRIGLILYPFWSGVFVLALFTDLIVTDTYVLLPFQNRPGPLENPLRLLAFGLILWVIVISIRLWRRSTGAVLERLRYFFIGTLIFAGCGGFITALLQLFGGFGLEPGLGSYFSLPWVVLTFYAIARYQLFDIRLILSQALASFLLLILFSAVQGGLFLLLEQALGHVFTIFATLSIVAFLFFGTPLTGHVESWVNALLLRNRYEYRSVLKDASRAMASILRLEDLLAFILNSLRDSLRIEHASLYLYEADLRMPLKQQAGSRANAVPPPDMLPADGVRYLLAAGQPVIRQVQENLLPDSQADGLVTTMRQLGAEVLVPIFFHGGLKGALALGPKRSGGFYSQNDLLLLETLAGHAAVAIENATLFREVSRVKESLEESEKRFRTLAETIPAAIFIHQGGRILYVNPAAAQLSGYSTEELLTMDIWKLIHPEFRDLIRDLASRRLAGEPLPNQYEFKAVSKSGETRVVIMSVGTMEYQGAKAIIGILFDITERKGLESKVQYMQKMEAIGKLAGGIAHDFSSILATIVRRSSMLQLGLQRQDPLQVHLEYILESTERAAALTERLLSLGSRREPALKPCDLVYFLAQQRRFLEDSLPPQVGLSIVPPDTPLPVMADQGQLERVLMNLVMNARDALPEGGRITISAVETSIDGAFARERGFGVAGSYACLMVEDTGCGMVEEVRRRIFEPFFTTKTAAQGAGFGLAIVHDIIEDHHGYITVESSPGRGAKFAVYLPLLAQELTAVNRPPAVPLWAGRATVIVAEDDAMTRRYTTSVLEEFGCTVIEASSGEDAVQQFSRNRDDVRLVITDIIMPRMSGREVCGAIRRIRPDTRFLFTGSYNRDLLVSTGILERDQPYLQKPASRAALLERIREVLLV